MTRSLFTLLILVVLGGCSTLPADGPSARGLEAGAAGATPAGTYALIELDYATVERIRMVAPPVTGSLAAAASQAPADVIARLKPLAVPGKPFFGSAGELVAMAYLDQNKPKEAGAMFASIAKDETVPDGLRSRSRQMAGLYGVDAIEDVDKVLEELGNPQDAAAPGAQ